LVAVITGGAYNLTDFGAAKSPRSALTTSQLLDVEQLLRQNVELRTVRLEYNGSDSDGDGDSDSFHPALFYQQGIVPLSEINRFRSASARRPFYAVADGVLAAKLLGRAVYSVCHSPTVVQMLLSEHVEIAFQSELDAGRVHLRK
jgi:hypothetical protein